MPGSLAASINPINGSVIIKLLNIFQESIRKLQSSALIRNITRVYSGDVISKVIGVGTVFLVIRGLTVDDYAAYTVFLSILILVPGLVGAGVNIALVRYTAEHISKTGEKPFEMYFVNFVFQSILYFLLACTLLLLSDKVAGFLFGLKDYESSLYFGLIAGAGYLMTQAGRGIYQAEEKFGNYVKTLWLRQFSIFIIVALLYALNKLNYFYVARAMMFIELVVGAIIAFHILNNAGTKKIISTIREQWGTVKEFIASTKWLIAYFLILTTFQRLDIFMLSHFSSDKELAGYGVAFRYYSLLLMMLSSIHAVLLPRFSRADMSDVSKQRQFTVKWLKYTGWLIIPIAVVVLAGKPLFIWINGTQYEKAYYIFLIFSAGIWLSLMFSPLVNVLMARKAFRFLFVIGVMGFISCFAGNYYLVPLWGGLGAALAVILANAVVNLSSGIRVLYSTR